MKNIIRATLIALTFAAAGTASAAQELSRNQAMDLMKIGTVSASGATHLDQLTARLQMKAQEAGASGFVITSAGGNEQLSGTATLYR